MHALRWAQDVRRHFPRVLDIGASHGALLPHIANGFGVEEVVQVESSEEMLMRDASLPEHVPDGVAVHRLAWDEEYLLLPPVRYTCVYHPDHTAVENA